MSQILSRASPNAVQELLDGGEFVHPSRILRDLTEAQATTVPPRAPHSIARIVAHMEWNQSGSLAHAREETTPEPEHLDDTFAPIAPGSWNNPVEALLAGVETCKRLAVERKDVVAPARDDTNACYDLAETALHNAYHLGQIVLLRRMQDLWPPQGGDENDF